MRRQPKLKLRFGDVLDRGVESVGPGIFESLQDPLSGLDGLLVVLLEALFIILQQLRERLLLGNRVNPSAFVLFLFELALGELTVGGFETFPVQLAVGPENRIINPA